MVKYRRFIMCPWHSVLPDPEAFVVAAVELAATTEGPGAEPHLELTLRHGGETRCLRFVGLRWPRGVPEAAALGGLRRVGVSDLTERRVPGEHVGAADLDGGLGIFLVSSSATTCSSGWGSTGARPPSPGRSDLRDRDLPSNVASKPTKPLR